jgi:hypothetical protein
MSHFRFRGHQFPQKFPAKLRQLSDVLVEPGLHDADDQNDGHGPAVDFINHI